MDELHLRAEYEIRVPIRAETAAEAQQVRDHLEVGLAEILSDPDLNVEENGKLDVFIHVRDARP